MRGDLHASTARRPTVVCKSASLGPKSGRANANSVSEKQVAPAIKIRGERCSNGTLYLALTRRRHASAVATRVPDAAFGSTMVGMSCQLRANPATPAKDAAVRRRWVRDGDCAADAPASNVVTVVDALVWLVADVPRMIAPRKRLRRIIADCRTSSRAACMCGCG